MISRSVWLCLSSCLLALGSMAIGQERASTPDAGAPPVPATQVGVAEASDHVDLVGRTEAFKQAEIRPRVSGWLTKVFFAAGAAVKQGDPLAEIDSRPYQADLDMRQADLQLVQARVRIAAAELEKARAAVAAGVAQHDLDRLAANVEQAQVAVQAAKTGLELSQLKLSHTRVAAPISGTISRPLVDAGNLATADQTLLATIVSTDPIYVAFEVDERTYLRLRRMKPADAGARWPAGLPALCGLADEEGFPRRGVVEASDGQFNPVTGTIRWRALFPNPGSLLLPGMFTRVRLITVAPQK
jgi:RND family efflux transporter MFP subunit